MPGGRERRCPPAKQPVVIGNWYKERAPQPPSPDGGVPESQRDSISQPGVARHELRRVNRREKYQTQRHRSDYGVSRTLKKRPVISTSNSLVMLSLVAVKGGDASLQDRASCDDSRT